MNKKEIAGKLRGRVIRKYENEANEDLHAAKGSIRRKAKKEGWSEGKEFHLALEQTRKYDKKYR